MDDRRKTSTDLGLMHAEVTESTAPVVGFVLLAGSIALFFVVVSYGLWSLGEVGLASIWTAVAVAAMAILVWMVRRARRLRGDRIALFEHGVVQHSLGKHTLIRWEELAGVREQQLPARGGSIYRKLTLVRDDGAVVEIEHPPTITLVGERAREVMRTRLPRHREALARGESVVLGPISLSNRAIRCADPRNPGAMVTLLWSAVGRIEKADGVLSVSLLKGGATAVAAVDAVDVDTVLTLAGELLAEARSRRR